MRIEISIEMPCTSLAQKVELEIEDMFSASSDFANVFEIEQVQYQNQDRITDDKYLQSIMIVKQQNTTMKSKKKY